MQTTYTSYLPLKLRAQIPNQIEGISFTEREIDVIAGLLNVKTHSKIAKWLRLSDYKNKDMPWPYISVKTVKTYSGKVSEKVRRHPYRNIQTFVDQTGTFESFRKHYQYLLLEDEFLKKLEKIHTIIKDQNHQYRLLLTQGVEQEKELRESIVTHLEYAGFLLCTNQNSSAKSVSIVLKDDTEDNINILDQKSYYHLIFAILEQFIDDKRLRTIVAEFNEQYERYKNGLTPVVIENSHNIKALPKKLSIIQFRVLFLIIVAVLASCTALWNHNKKPIHIIHSDLILPEKALLERSQIINQMKSKLNDRGHIKTITLTGIIPFPEFNLVN